jgi:glycosyltransferase involved in cell wall biosynthesis
MYGKNIYKKKLVSIILNCYNGESFLKQALESVEKQKYSNWELIFWDNKSTDNSKKILKSFFNKKLKNKVRYFKSDKHYSLYKSRNLALKKARGEFISFIDADDTWEADKLSKQIKLFKEKDVGVVYGNLWIRNEALKKKKRFIKYKLPEGYIFSNLINNYYVGILTSVIRKKFLTDSNINFNDKYNIIGDFDLFLKLSKKHKFKAIQEPVATYRLHDSNLSKKSNYEISELKYWLSKNNKYLKSFEIKQIKKKIKQTEFLQYKLKKNFFELVIFFFKSSSLFSVKNMIILILPIFILKRFIWFI